MSSPNVSPLPPPRPAEINTLGKSKEPFSHQAARFSAYAPFILFLLGGCVQGQMKAHAGTDVGRQLALALGALFFLTTVAAFVLGLVGLYGGIARRAVWTIAFAAGGVLLNTCLLAIWCSVIVVPLMRPKVAIPRAKVAETWARVETQSPSLSFEFPGNPTKELKPISDQVTVTSYQFFDGVTNFGVVIVDAGQARLPKDNADTAKWLDGSLDSWKKSLNGRIISQDFVSLGTLRGRELDFEFDPPSKGTKGRSVVGMAIGKAFFVDKSLVTLTAVLERDIYENDLKSARGKVARFFASLHVPE